MKKCTPWMTKYPLLSYRESEMQFHMVMGKEGELES